MRVCTNQARRRPSKQTVLLVLAASLQDRHSFLDVILRQRGDSHDGESVRVPGLQTQHDARFLTGTIRRIAYQQQVRGSQVCACILRMKLCRALIILKRTLRVFANELEVAAAD